MSNLFGNRQAPAAISPRHALEIKYNTARANLLVAIAFTLINLVMLLLETNTYFLFSAFTPYVLSALAADLTGFFSPEYYDTNYGVGEWDPAGFLPSSIFYAAIVITVIILALYAVCWFMSKKKSGWLIAALVLFSIDSIILLAYSAMAGTLASSVIDILFHAWVIYYLIVGIRTASQLEALPEEAPADMSGMSVPADITGAGDIPAETPAEEANVWDTLQGDDKNDQ